jgi:hypothetical protein
MKFAVGVVLSYLSIPILLPVFLRYRTQEKYEASLARASQELPPTDHPWVRRLDQYVCRQLRSAYRHPVRYALPGVLMLCVGLALVFLA